MDTLFIIGNGFDCYCHEMNTKYKDFRDYLLKLYPGCDQYNGMPGLTLTPDHHGYDYDQEEIVSYIVYILDTCQGDEWANLENALGDDIYLIFEDDLEGINMDDDDNDINNIIEQNQVKGNTIGEIFDKINEYFYDWVKDKLSEINYVDVKRKCNYKKILQGHRLLEKIMKKQRLYINFNYTYTLEKVYKISNDKVWHIHGKVGDFSDRIYFGHGNNNLEFDEEGSWGAKDSFGELGEKLKKDTRKVISDNKREFERLGKVRKIYSSGFSFSDVDMVYINELCKYINPIDLTWYFNKYDWEKNPSYIQKINELGFKAKEEKRW